MAHIELQFVFRIHAMYASTCFLWSKCSCSLTSRRQPIAQPHTPEQPIVVYGNGINHRRLGPLSPLLAVFDIPGKSLTVPHTQLHFQSRRYICLVATTRSSHHGVDTNRRFLSVCLGGLAVAKVISNRAISPHISPRGKCRICWWIRHGCSEDHTERHAKPFRRLFPTCVAIKPMELLSMLIHKIVQQRSKSQAHCLSGGDRCRAIP